MDSDVPQIRPKWETQGRSTPEGHRPNLTEQRNLIRQSVTNIISGIRTFSRFTLKIDDLLRFDIEITELDLLSPNDHTIFQPLSLAEFHKYELDEPLFGTLMLEGMKPKDLNISDLADRPITRYEEEFAAMEEGERLLNYIETLHTCYSKIEEPHEPFCMASNWFQMQMPDRKYNVPREFGLNSWPHDQGLLAQNLGPEHVGWQYQAVSEFREDSLRGSKKWPHLRITVCHGHTGDPHGILIGELGSIAQAILNRLNEPAFDNESYFPVLVLSFFGPRYVRLLQAVHRPTGYLELRVSRILDFTVMGMAPTDLILRYMTCFPHYDF
ncbi:hypothetical protein POX_a00080 [Penicillium oxalicum]|uniref:hypothetical protein n=1 Tax=Penicillium oxalicum TaxID=69781 RepID=UPI0020B86976|nr:hypothetical protein POX_a00080 [Penicillium oxalicum]KAI2793500.1 hypothetical protein POX_a00080 [Penicillium oxalicum]